MSVTPVPEEIETIRLYPSVEGRAPIVLMRLYDGVERIGWWARGRWNETTGRVSDADLAAVLAAHDERGGRAEYSTMRVLGS